MCPVALPHFLRTLSPFLGLHSSVLACTHTCTPTTITSSHQDMRENIQALSPCVWLPDLTVCFMQVFGAISPFSAHPWAPHWVAKLLGCSYQQPSGLAHPLSPWSRCFSVSLLFLSFWPTFWCLGGFSLPFLRTGLCPLSPNKTRRNALLKMNHLGV